MSPQRPHGGMHRRRMVMNGAPSTKPENASSFSDISLEIIVVGVAGVLTGRLIPKRQPKGSKTPPRAHVAARFFCRPSRKFLDKVSDEVRKISALLRYRIDGRDAVSPRLRRALAVLLPASLAQHRAQHIPEVIHVPELDVAGLHRRHVPERRRARP